MKMFNAIKEIARKVLRVRKVGWFKRKKFYFYGHKAILEKPYKQLTNPEYISVGNNTTILRDFRLAVYGEEADCPVISIGNDCYIGFGFTVLAGDAAKITVGNEVLIASNVLITNENHGNNPTVSSNYMDQELVCADVEIGDGCWIGEKVCILPGVTIGKRSIVGAGSIVTKSIPEYSIAVGNPAKVLKQWDFVSNKWKGVS